MSEGAAAPTMGRNIVVCLDGTGNEVKARGVSNVVKLVELLDLDDPLKQVAYYDPGVGTSAAASAWSPAARALSRAGGLLIGNGMRRNLGEAYSFLMNSWRAGSRIYVFGFSRGAYTARALAGMLYRIGLLRSGSENLVPYAVSVYARRRGWQFERRANEGFDRMDAFSQALAQATRKGSRAVPIEFMGLWDTVKAANVLGRDLKWPYTRQLPNVDAVRHAVSIDEKRRPYREYLLEPKDAGARPDLNETWFAGVHSDIGGSFDDDHQLGDLTLKWISEGAIVGGLLVKDQTVERRLAVSPGTALGTIHRMSRLWAIATFRTRQLPENARVHSSVRHRISADPEYARRIPPGVSWEDPTWDAPVKPRPPT